MLFKRRSLFGLRALLLILMAILLMMLDHQWGRFHRFRNQLEVVVFPIEKIVDTPIKAIHFLTSTIAKQENLVSENAKLRAHEFLLQAKLQKLLALERENIQLKELLKSTTYLSQKVQAANLLAVSEDSGRQQVILDKGEQNHIYVGQPVLDAYGVMGQVVDTSLWSAKVLLITDKNSAIPVQDYRDGVRAVAIGNGLKGSLSLINVPDSADVKKGDLFVSSGLGMRFPVGYPVGVVTRVVKSAHKDFALIELKPSAHMDRSQQVLLSWPLDAKRRAKVMQELNKPLTEQVVKGGEHG